MKPSVGRIVHYVSYGTPGGEYGKECRAAIVTQANAVAPATVSLCVLNPTGMFFHGAVEQDELPPPDKIVAGERTEHRGGTWHWPERAEEGHVPGDRPPRFLMPDGGVVQGKRDDDLIPALLSPGFHVTSKEQAEAMGLTDRFTAKMLEGEGNPDGRTQEP